MKTLFSEIGLFFSFIFRALKWLDKHTPLWILTDLSLGAAIGFIIYAAQVSSLGHGLTPEQIARGMIASGCIHLAVPLGVSIGTIATGWLLYWDIWSIKEYGRNDN